MQLHTNCMIKAELQNSFALHFPRVWEVFVLWLITMTYIPLWFMRTIARQTICQPVTWSEVATFIFIMNEILALESQWQHSCGLCWSQDFTHAKCGNVTLQVEIKLSHWNMVLSVIEKGGKIYSKDVFNVFFKERNIYAQPYHLNPPQSSKSIFYYL